MVTTLFLLVLFGWVFVSFGYKFKASYYKNPTDLKKGASLACFFVAIVLFLISISICLSLLL